jgi:hypothetical protein
MAMRTMPGFSGVARDRGVVQGDAAHWRDGAAIVAIAEFV